MATYGALQQGIKLFVTFGLFFLLIYNIIFVNSRSAYVILLMLGIVWIPNVHPLIKFLLILTTATIETSPGAFGTVVFGYVLYRMIAELIKTDKQEAKRVAKEKKKIANREARALAKENNERKRSLDQEKFAYDYVMKLSPHDFERFIGELFKNMGYVTRVTRYTGDYGIDVIAEKEDEKIAIQCKKYDEGNVSATDVQKLLGAMRLKGVKANKAILITTSDFTVQAKVQAEDNPIELWNWKTLYTMIKKFKPLI